MLFSVLSQQIVCWVGGGGLTHEGVVISVGTPSDEH